MKSFVKPEDYDHLVSVLRKICDGSFKDEFSLIMISGGLASGKTTLAKIISKLHKGNRVDFYGNPFILNGDWTGDLVFASEPKDEGPELIERLRVLNITINDGNCTYYKFSERRRIEKMPSVVFISETKIEVPDRERKRRVVYIHLPYRFKSCDDYDALVERCLKDLE